MIKRSAFIALLLLLTITPGHIPAQEGSSVPATPGVRGAELAVLAGQEKPRNIASLYDGSHALVIGIDQYKNNDYWKDLAGVAPDVAAVKPVLERHGFKVELAEGSDLAGDALRARIRDFITTRGGPSSRLLVYYAGHGYRERDGSAGYLVTQDAPRPDASDFRARAISMAEIRAFSEKAKAKHLLLVFDSCFSGSMINGAEAVVPSSAPPPGTDCAEVRLTRGGVAALPVVPRNIICASEGRARGFIASGTDRQLVKDDSDFRRRFVLGLTEESGQGADLDADGYVTGKELGLYLQGRVTNISGGRQIPTSGFIGPQSANQGDFIFIMPGASALEEAITYNSDPGLWRRPDNWTATNGEIVAKGPGIMLPKEGVRHSFRDFQFLTRLTLTKNISAQLVLRAQTPCDYYLIEINGGSHPDKNRRLQVRAYTVLDGKKLPIGREGGGGSDDKFVPLPPVLQDALNHEKELQINVTVEGNRIEVNFLSADRRSKTSPSGRTLYGLKFTDEKKTFTYGLPGFRLEESEELKISTISVSKIDRAKEGTQ